jgi:ribosomal protein S12 methylthiotransferase
MKNIGLINLGCPKNIVDLEVMLSFLDGYSITLNVKEADFIIINTCAFIKSARRETMSVIKTVFKNRSKRAKVIIAGCFVSKDVKLLMNKFKDVYAWIGVNDIQNIHNALTNGGIFVSSKPFIYNNKQRKVLLNSYSAYVKISEGCNHKCSFCVIPEIKGRYRSREIKDIVNEIKNLTNAGIKEINLISQDSSFYGKDFYGCHTLDKLIKEVLKSVKEYFWIRIMYLYPDFNLIKRVVDLMKKDRRICRYFDIPFQHVNNEILRDMQRGYSLDDVESIINFIKHELPDAVIRSSFIAGYPGETTGQFKELLFFIKNDKIDLPGFFKYSDEHGTPAYNKKNKVGNELINKRYNVLLRAAKKIRRHNKKDEKEKVLITGIKKKNLYVARTQQNAPDIDDYLLISSEKDLITGNFYDIKI